MALVELPLGFNPQKVTLPAAANVYRIVPLPKTVVAPRGQEKRVRVAIKVETGTIKVGVGTDDVSGNTGMVAADGWMELGVHVGQTDLYAQGAADNAVLWVRFLF